MTGNLGPTSHLDSQDAYSANALMQLGASASAGDGGVQQANVGGMAGLASADAAVLDERQIPGDGIPVQWPMNIFDG